MKPSKKIRIGKGVHKTTEVIVQKPDGKLSLLMYRPTDNSIRKSNKILKDFNLDYSIGLSHQMYIGDKILLKNKNYSRKIKGTVVGVITYNWDYNEPAGKKRNKDLCGTEHSFNMYIKYRKQQKRILKMKRKKYSLALNYINLCVELGFNPVKDLKRVIKKIKTLKKDGLKEINSLLMENKILDACNKLTDYSNIIMPKVYIKLAKQFSLSVGEIRQIIQSYKYSG
jgi:hypothetical protein